MRGIKNLLGLKVGVRETMPALIAGMAGDQYGDYQLSATDAALIRASVLCDETRVDIPAFVLLALNRPCSLNDFDLVVSTGSKQMVAAPVDWVLSAGPGPKELYWASFDDEGTAATWPEVGLSQLVISVEE